MKQKTSVYLDDPDREAVERVGTYYGISSDTDVLCFSVRAVARTLGPEIYKGEQLVSVNVQAEVPVAQKQWQVEVLTTPDQQIPHTFYSSTLAALRQQVSEWIIAARPRYIRSKLTFKKEGKYWHPLITEHDESAYKDFCKRGLAISRGPEYQAHGFIDGKFCLEYVRTTRSSDMDDLTNDLLQRGWHILSVSPSQETGTIWTMLGHTEEEAF